MKLEALPKINISKIYFKKKFKYGFVVRLRKLIYKNRKLNKHFLNKI